MFQNLHAEAKLDIYISLDQYKKFTIKPRIKKLIKI